MSGLRAYRTVYGDQRFNDFVKRRVAHYTIPYTDLVKMQNVVPCIEALHRKSDLIIDFGSDSVTIMIALVKGYFETNGHPLFEIEGDPSDAMVKALPNLYDDWTTVRYNIGVGKGTSIFKELGAIELEAIGR